MQNAYGAGQLAAAMALFGCMLGHAFPVWYNFKGGKAVMTFLAGVWFVDWRAGLICFGIFVIILFTIRFMSVASMSFAVLFPVVQSCPILCDPMNRSMPGLPVQHQLPEFTETHVH